MVKFSEYEVRFFFTQQFLWKFKTLNTLKNSIVFTYLYYDPLLSRSTQMVKLSHLLKMKHVQYHYRDNFCLHTTFVFLIWWRISSSFGGALGILTQLVLCWFQISEKKIINYKIQKNKLIPTYELQQFLKIILCLNIINIFSIAGPIINCRFIIILCCYWDVCIFANYTHFDDVC